MNSLRLFFVLVFYSIFFANSCNKEEVPFLDEIIIDNVNVVSDSINLLSARVCLQLITGDAESLQIIISDGSKDDLSNLIIKKDRIGDRIVFNILGLNADKDYWFELFDLTSVEPNVLFKGEFRTQKLPELIKDYFDYSDISQLGGFILVSNRYPDQTIHPADFFIYSTCGDLVLARNSSSHNLVVHYTRRGTLLTMDRDDESLATGRGNIILETTLAGDTLFYLRLGQKGLDQEMHHDLILTEDGHYLAITEFEVEGEIVDGLLLLDSVGNRIWAWDSRADHPPSMESYTQPWANSVWVDEEGDYIVSFRRISQVWKIDRDTGEVVWRLGYNGTIPLSGDDIFILQHTAHFVEPNMLLVFDNGQAGSFPWSSFYRPYSRIAEYVIDQSSHSISEINAIDLPEIYYAANMGSVQKLDNGFLVGASTSGYVLHVGFQGDILGTMKLDHRFYRANYIPNFVSGD